MDRNEPFINFLLEHRNILPEDRVLIASSFTKQKLKPGEWLIQPGKVAKHLYFINKGILKITVPHPHDRAVVYFFMKEHQFMTFLYSLYGNVPAEQGLQVACASEILSISAGNLIRLYDKLPYLKGLIDGIAQLSMAEMITTKNAYLTGEALEKYQKFIKTQPTIAERVPLRDVASYLGITPQSLSRIRRANVIS
jgi:CRP/FNR family transcriptional regulator, anaerobic regulatory protein